VYASYLDGKINILEKKLTKEIMELKNKVEKRKCEEETFLLLVLEAGKVRGFNYFSNVESLKKHVLAQLDDKIHYVIICRKYRKASE